LNYFIAFFLLLIQEIHIVHFVDWKQNNCAILRISKCLICEYHQCLIHIIYSISKSFTDNILLWIDMYLVLQVVMQYYLVNDEYFYFKRHNSMCAIYLYLIYIWLYWSFFFVQWILSEVLINKILCRMCLYLCDKEEVVLKLFTLNATY